MIENMHTPFVAIGIYSGNYPAALFSSSLLGKDLSRSGEGSMLAISGGLADNTKELGAGVCAFPTGVLGAGPIVHRYAELVVAKLVKPEDRIIIVDENLFNNSPKWSNMASDIPIQLLRTQHHDVIITSSDTMTNIRWCDNVDPASTIHVFAFNGKPGSLEQAIINCAESGGEVHRIVRDFDLRMRKNPEAAIADMGDFRLWTCLGGFDAQDIWIFRQDPESENLKQIAYQIAMDLDIVIYDVGTPYDLEKSKFFVEDNLCHPIPDDWEKIV